MNTSMMMNMMMKMISNKRIHLDFLKERMGELAKPATDKVEWVGKAIKKGGWAGQATKKEGKHLLLNQLL